MRVNQYLRPLPCQRPNTLGVFVPEWLQQVMGERERAIINHPYARFLHEDQDGNRYPAHQQWIESTIGTMLIDGRLKRILN